MTGFKEFFEVLTLEHCIAIIIVVNLSHIWGKYRGGMEQIDLFFQQHESKRLQYLEEVTGRKKWKY